MLAHPTARATSSVACGGQIGGQNRTPPSARGRIGGVL